MCYSEQLGTLFAAYEDGHVRGWDIETGQQNVRILCVCGCILCVCVCTSDNMYCITGMCGRFNKMLYTFSPYVRIYINVHMMCMVHCIRMYV